MNTHQHDPIYSADKLEELEARMSLRRAKNRDELTSAWMLNCERFQGVARERMQAIFKDCLRKMVSLQ